MGVISAVFLLSLLNVLDTHLKWYIYSVQIRLNYCRRYKRIKIFVSQWKFDFNNSGRIQSIISLYIISWALRKYVGLNLYFILQLAFCVQWVITSRFTNKSHTMCKNNLETCYLKSQHGFTYLHLGENHACIAVMLNICIH